MVQTQKDTYLIDTGTWIAEKQTPSSSWDLPSPGLYPVTALDTGEFLVRDQIFDPTTRHWSKTVTDWGAYHPSFDRPTYPLAGGKEGRLEWECHI